MPIYSTTLVDHRVFVLGGDQEVLDGAATFEVGLNSICTTDLFDTFTKTLCVGYDNVTLSCDFIGDSLGTCGALVIYPINCLTGRLVKSFLLLVQSPFRIFTLSESLPKVVHFLWEQLREGSTNSCTSQEGSNSPSSNSGNNRSQVGNNSVSSPGRQAGRLAPFPGQHGFLGSQHGLP